MKTYRFSKEEFLVKIEQIPKIGGFLYFPDDPLGEFGFEGNGGVDFENMVFYQDESALRKLGGEGSKDADGLTVYKVVDYVIWKDETKVRYYEYIYKKFTNWKSKFTSAKELHNYFKALHLKRSAELIKIVLVNEEGEIEDVYLKECTTSVEYDWNLFVY